MIHGTDLFFALFNNLAIFIALVAIYGYLIAHFKKSLALRPQIALGLAFGMFAVGCMYAKIPVFKGVVVDQRNAIIALSGVFGGPFAAFLSAAIAGAFRLFLGGDGAFAGVVGVNLAAISGVLLGKFDRPFGSFPKAALSAFFATLLILPGFLFVRDFQTGWGLLKAMSAPYGLAIFLGIFMVGLLLNREEKQYKAEELLRESEERSRELIDQSPVGLALCTMEGALVSANPKYCEIIGRSLDDALKLSCWELTPEKFAPAEQQQLEKLAATGRYGPYEKEFRHKDGHLVPVRLNGMIVVRNGENYIWSSVEDITALKKSEQDKQELAEQLRQAQKLEAIGTLAGGIAHDFNNLLSAVLGYSELTLRDPDCVGKSKRNLEHIRTAATRGRDLVKQILMFSRKGSGTREPIAIHRAIEEAVKLLRQTIPANISLNLEIRPDTGLVLADETQIHQIIMNLCTNAYHSMPESGGNIDIRLEPVAVDPLTAASYPQLEAGQYVRLTIADDGNGIAPEILPRIFEPFFTTKEQGKGTGLGLAVVHGIVQNHAGAIGVESEPGKGSLFTLFLPLFTGGVEAEKINPEAAISQTGEEHILWIDDEPLLAELGKETLESFGYRVTATTSAQAALNLFQAKPADYDLVITDQTMPEMTGAQLAKAVMRIRADIPVIICTGHSDILTAEKSRSLGVKALLMKPLESRRLGKEIRIVLDRSRGSNR